MASKAAEIQMKIRENSSELVDFISDLNRWEDKMKKEDEHLKATRRIDEKLPPIRSKKKVKSTAKTTKTTAKREENNNGNNTVNKQKVKSYDYDAWSKFDVEAACKEVSDNENEASSEDEVDDEEFEKIQEERRLQQGAMEKEKGNQLFKEGKYEAAINRYTTAIALHPTNPILYANRGMALIKVDRYGAAEQDCSVALELDPTYTKAIARRANARQKLKRHEQAKSDYESLLKYEPKNKQALTEIERLDKLLSNKTKTDNTYEKATIIPTKTTTSKNKQNFTTRKRSNKPLKRIYIHEIGGSDKEDNDDINNLLEKQGKVKKECNKTQKEAAINKPPASDNTSFNNNKTPINDRVPQTTTTETKFMIPSTSFVFETEFKKLRNDHEKLYTYIKSIPVEKYSKLMHLCIDCLISPFLQNLRNFYMRDKLPIHNELDSFTRVKRFSMATMFLSKNDKEVLRELFQYMSSNNYSDDINDELLSSLRKSYGIKEL